MVWLASMKILRMTCMKISFYQIFHSCTNLDTIWWLTNMKVLRAKYLRNFFSKSVNKREAKGMPKASTKFSKTFFSMNMYTNNFIKQEQIKLGDIPQYISKDKNWKQRAIPIIRRVNWTTEATFWCNQTTENAGQQRAATIPRRLLPWVWFVVHSAQQAVNSHRLPPRKRHKTNVCC